MKGEPLMRISRDQMFIEIAEVVAKRGTCPRAQVGAVLVDKDYNIIAIGYNGAGPGKPHCEDNGCELGTVPWDKSNRLHCLTAIHAEVNAMNKVGTFHDYGNLTLYVTHNPCPDCLLSIVDFNDKNKSVGYNTKITHIVFKEAYRGYAILAKKLYEEMEEDIGIRQYQV